MNLRLKTSFSSSIKLIVISLVIVLLQNTAAFSEGSVNPDDMLFIDFTVSKKDKPQINLTPDQVTVSVDGVKRDILYFSRITPEVINPDNPDSWIVANQLRGQHSLVLLLDLISLDNAALNSARVSIESMLNALPDNHNKKLMLAVLGNNLSFVQPFTSDKEKILQALNEVKATSPRQDYKSLIKSISDAFSIQYDQNPSQAMEEAIREANHFMIQIDNRRDTAIAGLETFAEWFTGLSGPKNVLFFSAGYPLMPSPVVHDIIRAFNQINTSSDILPPSLLSAKIRSSGKNDASSEIDRLTAKFNRNQLSLFSFDSRDVKSDGLAASGIRWLPQRLVARHNSSHITEGHEFLENLSDPTKGGLIYDPQKLLDNLNGSGQASYIVGIQGQGGEEPGEKASRVEIEITGTEDDTGKIMLTRRENFFTLLPAASRETLTGAFNFPLYYQDFSVSFKIGTGNGQLTAEAVLPPDGLTFVKDSGKFFCMLEVFGLLTDSEGNRITDNKNYTFAKQFPIRMDASQLKNLLKRKTVSASASASGIAAGEYTLTVVVRQPRTGLVSASRMEITME